MLPKTVISRYSNTYAKKRKRLGDSVTASWAAENGHLHILEYLVERKYDQYHEGACQLAANNGHFDCLKYLRETAKAPWNYLAVRGRALQQTTPSVYNTSSRTTVLSHPVGDTKMERYARDKHVHGYTKRERERDKLIYNTLRVTLQSHNVCFS